MFSFRNLQALRLPQGASYNAVKGKGEDGGGKNTDRHAAGGGGSWGWCIFSENTARTSSRHRRPREEWKNNILPFRPEFSVLVPLLLFSSFFFFHFVIT